MPDPLADLQAAYDAASATRAAFPPWGDSVPILPAVVAEAQRDAVVNFCANFGAKAALTRDLDGLTGLQMELPGFLAAHGLQSVEAKCMAHMAQAIARAYFPTP